MPTKSHIETFEEIPNKFFSLYQHFGTLDEHIKKFNSEGLELIDSCSLGVLRSEYPVQDNDIWCHTRALEGVIYRPGSNPILVRKSPASSLQAAQAHTSNQEYFEAAYEGESIELPKTDKIAMTMEDFAAKGITRKIFKFLYNKNAKSIAGKYFSARDEISFYLDHPEYVNKQASSYSNLLKFRSKINQFSISGSDRDLDTPNYSFGLRKL